MAILAGVGAFVLAYIPQLIAYQILNGRFGPHRSVGNKMSWTSPHALEVLLSPEHGFLFWTPLAFLALAGLLWLALSPAGATADDDTQRDRRWVAVCLLVMFAANVYITGAVESWTAAGAFGQRRFVNMTPLLVVGLALLFARLRSGAPRVGLAAAVVLCVWWNLALIAQFGTHMMDRQRMELKTNAYHAFVTLPKLAPALACRYVFDRQSFYQQPPRGGVR